MTYDIFDGRNLVINDNTDRLSKIVDIIKKYKPDIIAIQKPSNFGELNIDEKLSELLRLSYYSTLKSSGRIKHEDSKDIILLSRYKIQNTDKFQAGFQTGALIVNLLDTPLGNLSVVNMYLHETNEDNRL